MSWHLFRVQSADTDLDGVSAGRVNFATMSNQLSVIIPCKNECENIGACVASAQQVADEVLVADSGSTDGTLEIARGMGCRVVEREYGTSGDFKNWAIPQAANEWVFVLDADERITEDLAAEIRQTLDDPNRDGYWVYRRNHFMGHPIRFGPWRNDRCLRLFRRDVGRYIGPTDHAEVELRTPDETSGEGDRHILLRRLRKMSQSPRRLRKKNQSPAGTVGRLSARLTHYTCTSYSQYLPKLSRYADVQARIWLDQGRSASLRQLLLRFPLRFLQGFVVRLGFLDGLAGLQVCVLVAYLSWLKQANLWQLQSGRKPQELVGPAYSPTAPGSAGGIEAEDTCVAEITPGGAGGCRGDCEADRNSRRSLRVLRRRMVPGWFGLEARRRWRDILLRRIGMQRCHTPPILARDQTLGVRSCLPFVVAAELLRNPRMTFLQIGAFDGVGEDDLRELNRGAQTARRSCGAATGGVRPIAANVPAAAAGDAAAGGDRRE